MPAGNLGPYELNRVHLGRSPECLKAIPDGTVHTCITSPPYWGLRDYGTACWEGGDPQCDHDVQRWDGPKQTQGAQSGHASKADRLDRQECAKCGAKRIDPQIGLEPTPEEFIAKMVEVFREVRRVLHPMGTLWLNLGDSYASAWACNRRNVIGSGSLQHGKRGDRPNRLVNGLKEKDLIMIPAQVALALRADGWYLRSQIPWIKRNSMPESTADRPSSAVEYVYLFSKGERYFFDMEAIKVVSESKDWHGIGPKHGGERNRGEKYRPMETHASRNRRNSDWFLESWQGLWEEDGELLGFVVNPKACSDAHFATFPSKLIEPMILAGTSEKGCCPKCGEPWKRVVEKSRVTPIDYSGKHSTGSVPQAAGRRMLANIHARRESGEPHDNPFPSARTVGWQPTCNCPGLDGDHPGSDCAEEDNWPRVPCIVLDPFAGTGTTVVAAMAHGRSGIGFDISEEYVGKIAGVKVEAAKKGFTMEEVRRGQRSLFEEK